jgi:hypothetical protein
MFIRIIITTVLLAFFLMPHYVHAGTGRECLKPALEATKAALGDRRVLRELYDIYFGEALARTPVRRTWIRMSESERRKQIDRARKITISMADRLSLYARAKFKWKDNIAFVTLDQKTTKVRVEMSGRGCMMSDVCIDGYSCLSRYIGDASQEDQNK